MIYSFRCDSIFWIVNDVPYLMEGTWIEKKFDISSNNDSELLSSGECDTSLSHFNDSEFFEHLAFYHANILCQPQLSNLLPNRTILRPKVFRCYIFWEVCRKEESQSMVFLPSEALPCTAFVIGMAAFGQSMPLFLINNSIIDPLNSTTLHCWPKYILSSCSSSS